MCGIAGAIDPGATTSARLAALEAMQLALRHRGPDDAGTWADHVAGIGLAHRRLAILDLSPAGHQPMLSPSGRWVIAYNGEVYNYEDLRRELPVPAGGWRGHSDTEVLLAGFEHWGVEATLDRCIGMFAFAAWDRSARVLYLVRDRLGKKPLYYGWCGGALLFGSELKALCAHPAGHAPALDPAAVALQLRFSYIPAPHSIYRGIFKLPPGHLLRLPLGTALVPASAEPVPYWTLRDVVERAAREPFRGTAEEAVEACDTLLRDAVKRRMISDVPLGAFLSGGIDSSTVVALMQAQSARPVRTFTIGFDEQEYNEAEHAHAVARHLGTEHTELYVRPGEALEVIPRLPAMFDEPFSDSSQIPTYLVAQLARSHVTVSLSGDGGDELFGGYGRYGWTRRLWRRIGWMPGWLRRGAAAGLEAAPKGVLDVAAFWLTPLLNRYGRPASAGDKLKRLGTVLAPDAALLYRDVLSHWKRPGDLVRGAHEPPTVHTQPEAWPPFADLTQRMMFLDTLSYLPDDILVKVDRASMAVSLEARTPILDHRVVEFAWSLPAAFKRRDGQDKWPLRQLLHRHVPRGLVERPKKGFGVPLDAWLRGPLREWAATLLGEARLREEGVFEPRPIRSAWSEHLSGKRNWDYYLWDVLMFQAWLESRRG